MRLQVIVAIPEWKELPPLGMKSMKYGLCLIGMVLLWCSESYMAQPVPSLTGSRATLTLLSTVGSELPRASSFKARLEKPIELDGRTILPKGTLFQGRVRAVRARRLGRSGSVHLVFDTVRLPNNACYRVDISMVSLRESSLKVDEEGTIHPRWTKKRLLRELGLTGLTAKIGDDAAEVALNATVGVARYWGWGAGLAFYLIHKGSKVNVPVGTEIEVIFNRDPLPCLEVTRLPIMRNSNDLIKLVFPGSPFRSTRRQETARHSLEEFSKHL